LGNRAAAPSPPVTPTSSTAIAAMTRDAWHREGAAPLAEC
jgi:hypothetical protein